MARMTEQELKTAHDTIRRIYEEARRRMDPILVDAPSEYDNMRSDVTQGVYSALIIIYERDWPAISDICTQVETELHWWCS